LPRTHAVAAAAGFGTAEDEQTATAASTGPLTWDLTAMVQDWVDGAADHGVRVKSDTPEATPAQFRSLEGAPQPPQLGVTATLTTN
jgi:hypothetical protein